MSEAKYKVIREIGKGAYGTAYIVQLKGSSKRYVLKKVRMAKQTLKERQGSLLELQLLSSFKHRNILGFHESWVEGGCVACMLVELCEAGDLSTQLRLRLPTMNYFPEQHLHEMLVQLAGGLDYLHRSHIVHRDIKSGNIFISAEGCLKLADFGLAAVLGRRDVISTTLVGTPGCMAPQMLGEKVAYDPYKNDMYGLGVLMHEVTGLRPPFSGALNMEALTRKVTSGATPALPSQYSEQWKGLVKSLLSQDEASRPSAADILELPWLQEAKHRVDSRFGPEQPHQPDGTASTVVQLQPLPRGVQTLADMFDKQQKDAEEKKERDKARIVALQAKYAPKGLLQQQAQQDLKDWQKEQGQQPAQPGVRRPVRRSASTVMTTPRGGATDGAAGLGTGPPAGKAAARRATASGAPMGSAAAAATSAAANGQHTTLQRSSDAGISKDQVGSSSLPSKQILPGVATGSKGSARRPDSAPASPTTRKAWGAAGSDSDGASVGDGHEQQEQDIRVSSGGGSSSNSSCCPVARQEQEQQQTENLQEYTLTDMTCVKSVGVDTHKTQEGVGNVAESATHTAVGTAEQGDHDVCEADVALAANPHEPKLDVPSAAAVRDPIKNATNKQGCSSSSSTPRCASTSYGRSSVQRGSTGGAANQHTPSASSKVAATAAPPASVRRCSTGNIPLPLARAAVGQTSIARPTRTSAPSGSQGGAEGPGYAQKRQQQAANASQGGRRITAPGACNASRNANTSPSQPDLKRPLRTANSVTSILAARPVLNQTAVAVVKPVPASSTRRQSAGTVQVTAKQNNDGSKGVLSQSESTIDASVAAAGGGGGSCGVSKVTTCPATPRTLGLKQSQQAQEWLARQLQAVEQAQA